MRCACRVISCLFVFCLVLPLSSCKRSGEDGPSASGFYNSSGNYEISIPDRKEQLAELKNKNSDAVAWLEVPGTEMDEGVVQAGDNDYYLRKNVYGNYAYEGCFYLDYECLPMEKGLFSRNSIIYGHNLGSPMGVKDDPNGAKFAQLLKFADEEFAVKTPYVFITTADKAYAFEVFAVFYCEAHMKPVRYHYADYSDEEFDLLMQDVQARSEYQYEAKPQADDTILTLSTCTYKYGTYSQNSDQRFVVMGRLMREGDAYQETAKLQKNPNPKAPDFS